jgi:NitT/TauT family transport system substrate-binding protein
LCATDPARAARRLVDDGFTARYDYAKEALSELPYDKWRLSCERPESARIGR